MTHKDTEVRITPLGAAFVEALPNRARRVGSTADLSSKRSVQVPAYLRLRK